MGFSALQIILVFVWVFIVAIDQFDFLESLYQPIVSGNSYNIHLVCALVGGEPVRDIGAGGAGASLIGAQHLGQRGSIHLCSVHILLLIGQDLQRHTGKPYIGELVHICRGIYNDFAFHIFLHFQAAHAAVIPLSVTIIAVFQNPVNCFFKFFCKVFAAR